jgi:hypothetical protein
MVTAACTCIYCTLRIAAGLSKELVLLPGDPELFKWCPVLLLSPAAVGRLS